MKALRRLSAQSPLRDRRVAIDAKIANPLSQIGEAAKSSWRVLTDWTAWNVDLHPANYVPVTHWSKPD